MTCHQPYTYYPCIFPKCVYPARYQMYKSANPKQLRRTPVADVQLRFVIPEKRNFVMSTRRHFVIPERRYFVSPEKRNFVISERRHFVIPERRHLIIPKKCHFVIPERRHFVIPEKRRLDVQIRRTPVAEVVAYPLLGALLGAAVIALLNAFERSGAHLVAHGQAHRRLRGALRLLGIRAGPDFLVVLKINFRNRAPVRGIAIEIMQVAEVRAEITDAEDLALGACRHHAAARLASVREGLLVGVLLVPGHTLGKQGPIK